MHHLRRVTSLLVVLAFLAACQASPTPVAPTAVVPTQAPAPTTAPTAVPPSPVPTTAPTATTAPTEAPTAVPSTATAEVASLQGLGDAAFDAEGKLYISDCSYGKGARIFTVDSSGTLELYAGTGLGFAGDGGPASEAQFFCLGDIAFDSAGNLYLNDSFNARIRRIAPDGTLSTVAGSGPGGDVFADQPARGGFAGDGGPATDALLSNPSAIALDQQGNLYILDRSNNRVRKVDQAGIITTIAGVGTPGFSGDGGPATAAAFGREISGIAVDAAGNLYMADTDNARIRRIDLNGIITTIAGTGEPGFSGDGGPAAQAQLSRPMALAIDAADRLYFVDATSGSLATDRIRQIDADGTITTIHSVAHPGDPYQEQNYRSLNVDSQGNLYFGFVDNKLYKLDQDGTKTVVLEGCQGGC